jgi:hypothetical protein
VLKIERGTIISRNEVDKLVLRRRIIVLVQKGDHQGSLKRVRGLAEELAGRETERQVRLKDRRYEVTLEYHETTCLRDHGQ